MMRRPGFGLGSALVGLGLAAVAFGCFDSAGPSRAASPAAFSSGSPSAGVRSGSPAVLSRVLVFTRTLGFRHESIGAGVTALQKLGTENGFSVDATEDATRFTDSSLAGYDVVVWLSTTADVLDDAQQSAFQRYIQAGGGWVGVHAAADTEYDWPWYGQLIGNGAWFRKHPPIQTAQLVVEQRDHASTAHLPGTFSLQDEWYNFRANPRASVNVLLRLDESSYAAGEGAMGDHPIAWYHEFDGGRAWYTALGHRIELYTDPQYTQHLLGGLRWAAGVAP
jgi:cytochrome c